MPAATMASRTPGRSVAGPSVQTILALRISGLVLALFVVVVRLVLVVVILVDVVILALGLVLFLVLGAALLVVGRREVLGFDGQGEQELGPEVGGAGHDLVEGVAEVLDHLLGRLLVAVGALQPVALE